MSLIVLVICVWMLRFLLIAVSLLLVVQIIGMLLSEVTDRKETAMIELALPYPPSVNHYFSYYQGVQFYLRTRVPIGTKYVA